jgi:hypothetical protein
MILGPGMTLLTFCDSRLGAVCAQAAREGWADECHLHVAIVLIGENERRWFFSCRDRTLVVGPATFRSWLLATACFSTATGAVAVVRVAVFVKRVMVGLARPLKPRAKRAKTKRAVPPAAAHFLLYLFLPKEYRAPMIGDLVEEFEEDLLPVFGVRCARIWFWKQTITSIWPVVKRTLMKLAGLGLVEQIWKRLS